MWRIPHRITQVCWVQETAAQRHKGLTQSSISPNGQHIGRQMGRQTALDNVVQKINDKKDLQTSPAELTLGMTPMLPGDLLGEE